MKRFYKYFLILALFVILSYPFIAPNNYFLRVGSIAGLYVILCVGFDFILGMAGQFSLAHIAFYSIGAYTSALMSMKLGLPIWITLPVAGIVAGIFGLIIAIPGNRLSGPALGFATYGFSEIIRILLTRWGTLTNGFTGLIGIPKPKIGNIVFDTDIEYYYLIIFVVVILIYIYVRIKKSKTGRAFFAIKMNEVAAASLGINTFKYKILAFVLSSFYAGIAGSLYAHLIGFIYPNSFSVALLLNIFVMVIIGGVGNTLGVIISPIFFVFALEWFLKPFKDYQTVVFGVLLMVMMVFMPSGVGGLIDNLVVKIRGKTIKCVEK